LIDDGGGNVRLVFGPVAYAPLNQVAGPPAAAVEPKVVAEPGLAATAAAPPVPAPAPSPVVPAGAAVLANSPVLAALESQQVAPRVTVVPPTPPQIPSTTPTATPQYTGEIISL